MLYNILLMIDESVCVFLLLVLLCDVYLMTPDGDLS